MTNNDNRKLEEDCLMEGTIIMAEDENRNTIYKSLNEALIGGTSEDVRRIVRNREDVYGINEELKDFPKERKKIANSIDIYLNSTFAKSFTSTFTGIMLAFIAPAMEDLIKEIIERVFLIFTNQKTSCDIEIGVATFTFVAMAVIIICFCKKMLEYWNYSLELKRDLLLLKSLLEEN